MSKPVATLNINAGQTMRIEHETVIYEITAAARTDSETLQEILRLEQAVLEERWTAKQACGEELRARGLLNIVTAERDALKAKANNAHQAPTALWQSTKVQQLEAENKRLQAIVDALPKYEGTQSAVGDRNTVQDLKYILELSLGPVPGGLIARRVRELKEKASKAEEQLEKQALKVEQLEKLVKEKEHFIQYQYNQIALTNKRFADYVRVHFVPHNGSY